MGVLDKFLDAIKLNDDYDGDEYLDDEFLDEDDEDDEFLDDDLNERPKKKFFEKFARKKSDDDLDDLDDFEEEPKASARTAAAKAPTKQPEKQIRPAASSKITPMRSSRRSGQSANAEVCVIKPVSMEDTRVWMPLASRTFSSMLPQKSMCIRSPSDLNFFTLYSIHW